MYITNILSVFLDRSRIKKKKIDLLLLSIYRKKAVSPLLQRFGCFLTASNPEKMTQREQEWDSGSLCIPFKSWAL